VSERPQSDVEGRGLRKWLGISADAQPLIYSQIAASAEIASLNYWLGIFLSAGIATFGLVESSPAVIIGAMLISPLMSPIMATGLALAASDLYLGAKALVNLLASVAVSIVFSGFLVWILPFHSATSEIVARTNPNLLDLGIALFSGLAGSVVLSRGQGDGVTALPGVAIAVALMPPLCTVGFGLGSGGNRAIMGGAGLLFLTNLVAIVASAFLVFLAVGMNTAPATSRPPAHGGSFGKILAAGGHLRWRILMIAILLGSIALPLRKALLQVAGETLIRSAVQNELKDLVSADEIVSQQVTVAHDAIGIHLISTKPVSASQLNKARQDLMGRTGRDVQISVDAVASKSELAELMQRLDRPAPPPPPKPETIAALQHRLLDKVGPAIGEIWPSADAPLQDFDIALGAAGATIDVRYQAPKELDDVAVSMVLKSLQTKLGLPDLALKTEWVRPPRGPAPGKGRQSGKSRPSGKSR